MATFYASPAEIVDEEEWRSQAHLREAAPPADARALFNRYRRELTIELEPERFPVLPGV